MKRFIFLGIVLSFCCVVFSQPLPSGRDALENVAGIPGKKGYSGDKDAALKARFSAPMGLAVDRWNNMYVSDTLNHRIRRIDWRTGEVTTVAGTGEPGFFNDGGIAEKAGLKNPTALVFDKFGNLFIADTGNHRIRMLTPRGYLYTVAGNGRKGYDGERSRAASTALNQPVGLAFDQDGNLYFADTGNHRIRRISRRTGLVNTVAGTGEAGADGDLELAVHARLNHPSAIVFDRHDNLYIADTRNHKIRFVDHVSKRIFTLAGSGISGWRGDNASLDAQTRFNNPSGLALDRFGSLYVADTDNQRIRRIRMDLDTRRGWVETVAGTGKRGYNGNGLEAWSARLAYPGALVITPFDELYVADTANQLVRRVAGISHLRVPTGYIPAAKERGEEDQPFYEVLFSQTQPKKAKKK